MPSFSLQLEESLPDLWRYAFALGHDRDLADDLVQDTIERAMRKRALWLPGRPVKPWLMKILLNLFRDHCARSARHGEVMAAQELVAGAASHAGSDQRLELLSVARGIAALPSEQREALLAVTVGGLDYAQAARVIGIPKGTLMSRIARARERLKQVTKGDDGPAIRRVKGAHHATTGAR